MWRCSGDDGADAMLELGGRFTRTTCSGGSVVLRSNATTALGVGHDIDAAAKWYALASDGGPEDAERRLFDGDECVIGMRLERMAAAFESRVGAAANGM